MSKKSKNTTLFKFIAFILAIVVFLLFNAAKDTTDENLNIYFLDIGQGDATYIRDSFGNDILVDGGPGTSVLDQLGLYMPFYDKKIEYIFISHAHADHIGGIVEILDRYEVGTIYMTDAVSTSSLYLELLEKIKINNIETKLVKQGQIIDISDGLNVKILWPKESYKDKEVEDLNDTSIVMILNYQNLKVMFTGDAEAKVYEDIVKKYSAYELKSDILKVPHHGSKDADDYGFIKLVNPELAVIEVGADNPFGHPHKDTLEKLNSLDIKVLRTDKDGTVKVSSDGINFWTQTY